MRFLKAVFAGIFVMAVGLFTALVLAVSALAVFIGRRLQGGRPPGQTVPPPATGARRMSRPAAADVIDVDATEVPTSPSSANR